MRDATQSALTVLGSSAQQRLEIASTQADLHANDATVASLSAAASIASKLEQSANDIHNKLMPAIDALGATIQSQVSEVKSHSTNSLSDIIEALAEDARQQTQTLVDGDHSEITGPAGIFWEHVEDMGEFALVNVKNQLTTFQSGFTVLTEAANSAYQSAQDAQLSGQ